MLTPDHKRTLVLTIHIPPVIQWSIINCSSGQDYKWLNCPLSGNSNSSQVMHKEKYKYSLRFFSSSLPFLLIILCLLSCFWRFPDVFSWSSVETDWSFILRVCRYWPRLEISIIVWTPNDPREAGMAWGSAVLCRRLGSQWTPAAWGWPALITEMKKNFEMMNLIKCTGTIKCMKNALGCTGIVNKNEKDIKIN